jgi:D-alanyl-D-alanine carboxypeptidase
MMTKFYFVVGLAMLASGTSLLAQNDQLHTALDNLVTAYQGALAAHDDKVLRWRDGIAMPISDGVENKPFQELLRHALIADQFRLPYPRGPLANPPAVDADPGRFRNTAFFTKMYGDCQKGDVSPRLVSLAWLPKTWGKTTWGKTTWGKTINITSINGVDAQLRAVSAEIDELPEKIKRAAYPIAGTYNCRTVADTGQPSPHGYGIAIDLNTAFSDYWYWQPHDGAIVYRNRMPAEIVAIFEKHGFIWGGKWYHFDTMHFEFRPELLVAK